MSLILPCMTAKDIARVIERNGFTLARQSGSHKIYKNSEGRRVTIPFHGGTILHPKVLKSILKDMNITAEDLIRLL